MRTMKRPDGSMSRRDRRTCEAFKPRRSLDEYKILMSNMTFMIPGFTSVPMKAAQMTFHISSV